MPGLKTINSDVLLKKQLKDVEFKKEYDALAEEYELASEIIRLRKKSGLTQRQLAELAGTSQPSIARLEFGEYKNYRRYNCKLQGISACCWTFFTLFSVFFS